MGLEKPREGQILFEGEPLGRNLRDVPPPRADGLPGPHRGAEPPADDLRVGGGGPADPRHPPQPGGRLGEEEMVARALSPRRPAPARALLPAVSARDLRRAASARGDRRGARPGARDDRRRRARELAGRLGEGRDPLAAAPAARRPRDRGAGGDARPRAGVVDRRPRRGDVPRTHRGDRSGGEGPDRAAASLHEGAAGRRARGRRHRPAVPAGRATRPHEDPAGLPVQPPMPGARRGPREGGRRRSSCACTRTWASRRSSREHFAACHLTSKLRHLG